MTHSPELLFPLARGQHSAEGGLAASSYCVFYGPLEGDAAACHNRLTEDGDNVVLELVHGDFHDPKALRVRQLGNNALVEESDDGAFRAFLADKAVRHFGQLLMYALQFEIRYLAGRIDHVTGDMKRLEDDLDNCIDNDGTYRLLDFRRRYTDYGNMVISVKEILTRFDKGYYPMQMQNSYVLQGQVMVEFQFLEERYDLVKNIVIKDFDTYTSIVNNNINRNARLIGIIALVGVVLNFMFGSLLAVNPVLGVAGGIAIGLLSTWAIVSYHRSRRLRGPRRRKREAERHASA